MHIVVVANCQARPIAALVKLLAPEIAEVSTIVVHLAKADGAAADHAMLDTADLIFAQFVTDQYSAGHLSTSRLKDRYGAKVISWPNIFFRGQNFDLAYASARRSDGTHMPRILGPLREYHHKSIYTAWRNGSDVKECLQMLNEGSDEYSHEIKRVASDSLAELRKREAHLDTSISDIVEADWLCRRLFFTFNHPVADLLQSMAMRLLARAEVQTVSFEGLKREPLDLIIPPTFPREVSILGRALGQVGTCRGAKISFQGSEIQIGDSCLYSCSEFVELSFGAYDKMLKEDDEIHFTPA